MNPIHESGFASIILLFFGTAPAALCALVALVIVWKRPKGAAAAATMSILFGALVCLAAALITVRLHSRVDYSIDTGGYGPPASVRAEYGADWHASARITAWVGLLFPALPLLVSGIVVQMARKKEPEIPMSYGVFGFAAFALFVCFLASIL